MRFPESGAKRQQEWDEEAWERFLKREDVRTAKFQELFETLGDCPDRNQIIMKELGLRTPMGSACDQGDCDRCSARGDCEVHEMHLLFEWPENGMDDAETQEILAIFDEVQRIPAYQQAHTFSLRLREYFGASLRGREPRDANPAWVQDVWGLLDAAALVPAQLAGGHGIGYERDCICGNIANCKRALNNARQCIHCLREMKLPKADAAALVNQARQVCAVVAGWIEDLRSRVA